MRLRPEPRDADSPLPGGYACSPACPQRHLAENGARRQANSRRVTEGPPERPLCPRSLPTAGAGTAAALLASVSRGRWGDTAGGRGLPGGPGLPLSRSHPHGWAPSGAHLGRCLGTAPLTRGLGEQPSLAAGRQVFSKRRRTVFQKAPRAQPCTCGSAIQGVVSTAFRTRAPWGHSAPPWGAACSAALFSPLTGGSFRIQPCHVSSQCLVLSWACSNRRFPFSGRVLADPSPTQPSLSPWRTGLASRFRGLSP